MLSLCSSVTTNKSLAWHSCWSVILYHLLLGHLEDVFFDPWSRNSLIRGSSNGFVGLHCSYHWIWKKVWSATSLSCRLVFKCFALTRNIYRILYIAFVALFIVFVHPLLLRNILLQQWHKKNVDVGKSDCWEPLFEVMAKFMLETLQVRWKRFAIHQSGQKRWAIHSQHGHTEGSLYSSSDHNFPAHSSALLALKQRVGIITLLYTRRWDYHWVQSMWPIPVHLYWYLHWFIVAYRFDVYYRKKKSVYYRKDRPCKFNVYCKLPRLNACCSCRVKPPYRASTERVLGLFCS